MTRRSPVHVSPPPPSTGAFRASLRMHGPLTSTFALAPASEMRVSRVNFSGPYQGCVRMPYARWRGASGRHAAGSRRRALSRRRWIRLHRGMRTHCPDQAPRSETPRTCWRMAAVVRPLSRVDPSRGRLRRGLRFSFGALSPRLSQSWSRELLSPGPVGRASLDTSSGLWTRSVLLDEGPVQEELGRCAWPISGPRFWPREVPAPRSGFQR